MKNLKRLLASALALVMVLGMVPVGSIAAEGDSTVYVADYDAGGRDTTGDGSYENPYLTIEKALQEAGSGAIVNIALKSDTLLTQKLTIGDGQTVVIDGTDAYTIKIQPDSPIGTGTGALEIVDGANVTLKDVTVTRATGSQFDAGLTYVRDAELRLDNVNMTNGQLSTSNVNDGGSAIHVAPAGVVNVNNGTSIENNDASGRFASGALFVESEGTLNLNGAVISGNTITGSAGRVDSDYTGIYVQNGGNMYINGETPVDVMDGIYIEVGANAHVGAAVGDSSNIVLNRVFLETEYTASANVATLDIIGETKDSTINIEVDDSYHDVYRLISAADGYDIVTNFEDRDEQGWTDIDNQRDIRYMVYDGVPGLYFYYFTMDAQFEDVDTLTGIKGTDINGDPISYFAPEDVQNTTKDGGLLTIKELIAIDDGDFQFNFTTDEANKDYRIPVPEAVSVVYDDGRQSKTLTRGTDYVYEPDFEGGTAVLTVKSDALQGLKEGGTLKFNISGEKYSLLTLNMHGPLFTMSTDVTGQKEIYTLSVDEPTFGDNYTSVTYHVTQNNKGVAGVTFRIYDEHAATPGVAIAEAVTDDNGYVTFVGMPDVRYIRYVMDYSRSYHVIARDVMKVTLSHVLGEKLKDRCDWSDESVSVSYDSTGDEAWDGAISEITGVTSDTRVNYYTTNGVDTVTFHANVTNGGNQDEPTTKDTVKFFYNGEEFSVQDWPKSMETDALTYGLMPTITMVGYTASIWHTSNVPGAGEQYNSNTKYDTTASPKDLYAHWTKNQDINYKVQHWVEATGVGGVNPYMTDATETREYDGKTYYLWETDSYENGTADTNLPSLIALRRTEMTDPEHTWWTMNGLTPRTENDNDTPFVLADGSSVFNIFYDRNEYTMKYLPGEGTMKGPIDTQTHKYGAAVGSMLVATRPGYVFGGWYKDLGTENGLHVVDTSWYSWTNDIEVEAQWNHDDTTYSIMLWVQDRSKNTDGQPETVLDTYTRTEWVTKNNAMEWLTAVSDVEKTVKLSEIDALKLDGFTYAGFVVGDKNTDLHELGEYTAATDSFTFKASEFGSLKYYTGNTADARQTVVHLIYTRNIGHVDFKADDTGDETFKSVDVVFGDDFKDALPETNPTKPGYDFTKWVDQNGDEVTGETSINPYIKDGTVDVEIRPVWTVRTYFMTYIPGDASKGISFDTSMFEGFETYENTDVQGGYVLPKPVAYDGKVGTMPKASWPGYVFDGWFLPDGTQVTEDTILTIDNVVIKNDANSKEAVRPLTAKFTPYENWLVFDANGGQVTPDRIRVTYDKSVGELPVPTRTGYTFTGWTLNQAEPGMESIKSNDLWKVIATNGSNVTAVANWVPIQYVYTMVLNDVDNGNGSTKAYLKDSTINGPLVDFDHPYASVVNGIYAERNGYSFIGWALDKNDMSTIVTETTLNTLPADATLYAMWQPKVYLFHIHLNGGSDFDATIPYGEEFVSNAYANEHYAAYSEKYGLEEALTVTRAEDGTYLVPVIFDTMYGHISDLQREHYKFEGYKVSAPLWTYYEAAENKFKPVIDGEVVKSFDVDYTDTVDEYITLDAVWTPIFDFDLNLGRNPEAVFEDGTNEMKSIVRTDIIEAGKLPEPTFEGFKFLGWYDQAVNEMVDFETVANGDVYCKFIAIFSPLVTFNANGGKVFYHGEWLDSVTVDLESLTVEYKNFLNARHETKTFCGWMADDGTDMTVFGNLAARYKPVTLTATWDIMIQFMIPDGVRWPDGTTAYKSWPASVVGDWQTLPEAMKQGHDYLGWAIAGDPDAVDHLVTPVELAEMTHSVTVYPVFSVGEAVGINVNVVIYANDGVITLEQPAAGWFAGMNRFSVKSEKVCGVGLIRGDKSKELFCETSGVNGATYYESLQDGDTIVVVLKGDVNLDGEINGIDPTYLMRFLVDTYELDFAARLASDVSIDGELNGIDPTYIMRYLVETYQFGWNAGPVGID